MPVGGGHIPIHRQDIIPFVRISGPMSNSEQPAQEIAAVNLDNLPGRKSHLIQLVPADIVAEG